MGKEVKKKKEKKRYKRAWEYRLERERAKRGHREAFLGEYPDEVV